LEMLVVALTFGITVIGFIGCSKNVDRRFNGTWKGNGINEFIYKYNAGKFEISNKDGSPFGQGTYTTSDGKITYIPTHIFGTDFGLDPRWYSKNELEKDHNSEFASLFEPDTVKYIVDDNKITYINDYETYTKTLVSRDGKFTQATSNSKKSAPVEKNSGKKSTHKIVGKWTDTDGSIWTFNSDGKLTYNDNIEHSVDEYQFSVTDTELMIFSVRYSSSSGWIITDDQKYKISFSPNGKTLMLTDGEDYDYKDWHRVGPSHAKNQLTRK